MTRDDTKKISKQFLLVAFILSAADLPGLSYARQYTFPPRVGSKFVTTRGQSTTLRVICRGPLLNGIPRRGPLAEATTELIFFYTCSYSGSSVRFVGDIFEGRF